MLIRRARHSDASDIITAHVRSIREICSKDYTSEQIEAWAGRYSNTGHWCDSMDRDYVWVIEHENKIQGFGHLALMDEFLGEVMGLYFTPELKGKGMGKKIFHIILEEAKSHALREVQLLSTLTARTFYERFGFEEIAGLSNLQMRGVDIPCVPMVLNL